VSRTFIRIYQMLLASGCGALDPDCPIGTHSKCPKIQNNQHITVGDLVGFIKKSRRFQKDYSP